MQSQEIAQQDRQSSGFVSPVHQAWREKVILERAAGAVRNRAAYLRKALPAFISDETHEVGQWLVSRLVEHIDRYHPSIDGMKSFLKQEARRYDLPLPDDQIESVIQVAYFKWKAGVLDSVVFLEEPGQKAFAESPR